MEQFGEDDVVDIFSIIAGSGASSSTVPAEIVPAVPAPPPDEIVNGYRKTTNGTGTPPRPLPLGLFVNCYFILCIRIKINPNTNTNIIKHWYLFLNELDAQNIFKVFTLHNLKNNIL